jgi:hypothetical protein
MQEAFNLNEYEPMDRLSVMANSFFIEDNPIDAFLLLDPIVDVVIMGNNPEAIHEQQDAYGLQQTLMQTAEVQCWGDGSSPARLSAAARKKYKHIAPPPMDSKIGISPNPSNTISNISFSNPTNELFQCQVYNISGVLVQTINNIQANHFEIDVSNYLSGLYYVELKSNTNKYKTKLLVQNN